MKAYLIRWLLPVVLDMIMSALLEMVQKTDNTIDDELVATLDANREKLMDAIKNNS